MPISVNIKSNEVLGKACGGIVALAIAAKEKETGKKIGPLAKYSATIRMSDEAVNVTIPNENIDYTFNSGKDKTDTAPSLNDRITTLENAIEDIECFVGFKK